MIKGKYKKFLWLLKRKFNSYLFRLNLPLKKANSLPQLSSFFSDLHIDELSKKKELIIKIANLYLNHYFDILGSGWKKSVSEKKLLCQQEKIISADYRPIDWHSDMSSGYRWNNINWYTSYRVEVDKGYDIKSPWELTRMHHLIWFCWAYFVSDETDREKYYIEFRNQIIDFIESNPPYYGVNWVCPMDVAIRAVNLLISYDIFKSLRNKDFDNDFEKIFKDNIYLHGYYLFNNLENPPDFRGNHYLANLCGLIFISSYLRNEETKRWLNYAYKEIIKEFDNQFNVDGTNYEASTAYHCLSFELVLYSFAMLLNKINREMYPLPLHVWGKLIKSANFIRDIQKKNGEIILIGDNDSGRLLKAEPSYEIHKFQELKEKFSNIKNLNYSYEEYPYENSLKKDDLLSGFSALICGSFFQDYKPGFNITKTLIENISSSYKFDAKLLKSQENLKKEITTECTDKITNEWIGKWNSIEDKKKAKYFIKLKDGWDNNLSLGFYEDFGLYIYNSDYAKIFVRCGGISDKTKSGHAHNDQLSVIISTLDNDIILDPGTYRYTTDVEKRNLYRSIKAHFTPRCKNINLEQEEFTNNLFEMKFRSDPKCLFYNDRVWLGEHYGFGFRVVRLLLFVGIGIEIYDMFLDGDGEMDKLDIKTQVQYCPAYGWINAE